MKQLYHKENEEGYRMFISDYIHYGLYQPEPNNWESYNISSLIKKHRKTFYDVKISTIFCPAQVEFGILKRLEYDVIMLDNCNRCDDGMEIELIDIFPQFVIVSNKPRHFHKCRMEDEVMKRFIENKSGYLTLGEFDLIDDSTITVFMQRPSF